MKQLLIIALLFSASSISFAQNLDLQSLINEKMESGELKKAESMSTEESAKYWKENAQISINNHCGENQAYKVFDSKGNIIDQGSILGGAVGQSVIASMNSSLYMVDDHGNKTSMVASFTKNTHGKTFDLCK